MSVIYTVFYFLFKVTLFILCKETYNIEDEDESLQHCLADIRVRINNMGTVADSNEFVVNISPPFYMHVSVPLKNSQVKKFP